MNTNTNIQINPIEEIYIILSIDSNRINANDGQYKVRFNYINDSFISDSDVIVKSNLIDIKTLIQASREVSHKSEYWGKFLETIEFNKNDNIIDIEFGS